MWAVIRVDQVGKGITCSMKQGYTEDFGPGRCLRCIKMLEGRLERVAHIERLKEIDLFRLKERRFVGDISAVCNYVVGSCSKDGARLFLEVHSDQIRGNKQRL